MSRVRREDTRARPRHAAWALFAVALAACTTTVRQHPEFETRRAEIRRVSVMPPEAEVVRVVFKGDNEPLHEEAAAVARRLADTMEKELSARGFETSKISFEIEPGVIVGDPDLRFENTQIQRAYAEVSGEMYRSPSMLKDKALKYQATVGPEVNVFSQRAGADALAFARFSGFHKSGGEVAKDVAMTVLIAAATLGNAVVVEPTDGAVLQVALVDGTSGEILWANITSWTAEFQGEGLERMVEGLFKDFPVPARAFPKGKRD